MLVSICILLLAKLEKTPWLLKAANIHSPQEDLSSLFILANRTSFLCLSTWTSLTLISLWKVQSCFGCFGCFEAL
jgi:hypothetical protein